MHKDWLSIPTDSTCARICNTHDSSDGPAVDRNEHLLQVNPIYVNLRADLMMVKSGVLIIF
jgi:hypothetical protein